MRSRRAFAIFFVLAAVPFVGKAQNPIQIENSNPGTSGWQLSNPALNREIEGYASLTSVNVGGSINFSVSTSDSTFKIEVFRTGWYGGVGARLLQTVASTPGVRRSTPNPDPITGLLDCNWPSSYTLNVPSNWVSGIYLARLTGNTSGKQSYILFVVRDDLRTSDLLFQSSVTTFQAYNFWPSGATGKSLYDWAPAGRAWKVSFNRPYVLGMSYSGSTPGASTGVGAGEYLSNVQPGPAQGYPIAAAGFEYNMVRWLEKNGYDVTYITNIDLHENATLLAKHRAYLSVGHNEYWSMEMRQNVQNALTNGLNLGFFSSNSPYWQIRLEPAANGAADRTIVSYKYDAQSSDPMYSTNPQRATVEWRDSPVNMPEAALTGNEYVGDPFQGDIVISNAAHWLMNGTGLKNGDHLAGMLGYEVDVAVPGTSPPNLETLASSPVGPFADDYDNPPGFSCNTQTCNSTVNWYSAGKSFVFAAGSMQWSWGLDDYNAPSLRSAFSSTPAQTLTANVLAAFITAVQVTTTSLPSATAGAAYPAFQMNATGGGQPYSWSATGLPSGMTLNSSGILSGTPTVAGTSSVTFTVTDAASHTATKTLSLVVNSAPTYTISGQVTSAGVGLSGVGISLNTGPTTTTDSSGKYTFSGLFSGNYTVTPSLNGYQFNPANQSFTNIAGNQVANFTATTSTSTARAISINFVGNGTAMAATETAGVVPKTNWNNGTANARTTAFPLNDETGASTGASATWTSDNNWAVPITDTAGNARMIRGYLDDGNSNPITVNISGLPASSTGYDVYVYTDGDNEGSTVTGTYKISGTGITTTSIDATDPGNVNFSGTFQQATNSAGNYVKFSGIKATSFTITATPKSASDGVLRAPLNGIQIIPSPQINQPTARAVSINFVGNGTAMAATETAGVVPKTNWNNGTGNARTTAFPLNDETGASTGASATWTSDNNWAVPITDTAGNARMIRGYLDDGNSNPITVNISGLPASSTGYDVYVYTDGDNEGSTVTGTYKISGAGITTTSIDATDPGNVNFSGTFQQATNSTGNYVKFSGINATSFTITATPKSASDGVLRAPLNGIQIIPSPQANQTTARTVSINFVGNGTAMAATETAGVVAKTNWNNGTGNARTTAFPLNDETGASTGASATWTSDNNWAVPITDTAGNFRMMRGYLDTGAAQPTTVNLSGLPVSTAGYDIYVYFDGDNAGVAKTATYSISGAGITTATITGTDAANTNFNGTFVQANGSVGNYLKFSSIQATAFTLTATPPATADGRAPVDGIQVVPH